MTAMPARAEPRRASIALSPATVRPRQVGALPRPADQLPRQVGAPPRPADQAGRPPRHGPARGRTRPACGRAPRSCGRIRGPRHCLFLFRRPGRPPRPTRSSLRLTRRGRVVLAVCAAAVAALFWFAAASSAPTADHGASPRTAGHSMSRIVVQPGQTLWSIALQADPQADPRLTVQRILAVNGLPGGSIQAGQRLLVPG